MYKISVIVPVYNVESYLSACLESLINQTYQQLEIILINDGSTDNCPKICDSYASKDSKIVVIHQKNVGLSGARNTGLRHATGDLISFMDSDDLLSLDYYQKLSDILLENKADIVECAYAKFETENDITKINQSSYKSAEIYKTEKALELLMNEYIKQMVWNKLYRKEVIKNILFPVGKINEDEYWSYKIFGNAKKIIKIHDILYFYRQQPESIMGKDYSLKRLDGLDALEERIQYMQMNFPELENLAIKKYCLGAIFHFQMLLNNSHLDANKSHRNKIYKNIKKYNTLTYSKHWRLKEIVYLNLFIISPTMLFKLVSFLKK